MMKSTRLIQVLLCLLSIASLISSTELHGSKKRNKTNLEWWQETIIYQIYPKSYKDSNNDGIGDLGGIINSLDYLLSIGIKTIWLNPIYPSGGKDTGYDVTSFVDIDPLYGQMSDFERLVEELHSRGMYIIMDFIPNHTSDQHEWFIKSCNNEEPYKDYYVWRNGTDKNTPPNNWQSVFGNSSWEYNEKRQQWFLHQFLKEQPDVNPRSENLREELKNAIKFWLETKNVDGIRIDAIRHLFEEKNFLDEPLNDILPNSSNTYNYYNHIYTTSQPETYEILTEWRLLADEISARVNRTKFLVVEAYENVDDMMQYYSYKGKAGAHFPFNFQFICLYEKSLARSAAGCFDSFTPENIKNLMDPWLQAKPENGWSNWQTGNHDNSRIGSRVGEKNIDLANALILLIGGTPITYYGEEIGMVDLPVDLLPFENVQDIAGQNFGPIEFVKYTRDYERTPMQWNSNLSTSAGFTSLGTRPWLPVNPNTNSINVESEVMEKESHLSIYKELVKLRKLPSFAYGSFKYAIVSDKLFSFIREAPGQQRALVIMNLSDDLVNANFKKNLPRKATVLYAFGKNMSNKFKTGSTVKPNSLKISPRGCLILGF